MLDRLDAVTDHFSTTPLARSTMCSSRALSKTIRVFRQCPIRFWARLGSAVWATAGFTSGRLVAGTVAGAIAKTHKVTTSRQVTSLDFIRSRLLCWDATSLRLAFASCCDGGEIATILALTCAGREARSAVHVREPLIRLLRTFAIESPCERGAGKGRRGGRRRGQCRRSEEHTSELQSPDHL